MSKICLEILLQNEKSGIIKRLKFSYDLVAEYTAPINHHSFSVIFLPEDTARQKISDLKIDIKDCQKFCITKDNFKNKKLYGLIQKPHDRFEVHISGNAESGIDIYEEYTDDPFFYSLLKTQTELTKLGEKLTEYHKSLELEKFDGVYDKALHIMQSIPQTFKYNSGATEIHETAENAFSIGKGVCQDYAHIMLSLLRAEHIPARYVVGMIIGEGSSHAWVEALCKGYWYGFDPTNCKLVNDEYVKVSCGRDSSDCSVIRGSFYGTALQKQTEKVSLEEIQNNKD